MAVITVQQPLWSDLEQGIDPDGDRKNADNDEYKTDNPIEE